LLARNDELNQRVKRAAANSTEVNERFLRRTSAELHDGPIQELGLAMLRLDRLIEQSETSRSQDPGSDWATLLLEIQKSLERSLQEIRNISKGLGVPQLEKLSLPEILQRVVNSHERRTGTQVMLEHHELPEQVSLPVKITLFRFVQEALNNAFHHAQGKGQRVLVTNENGSLQVAVADEGPGFDPNQPIDWDEHLGLAGMRERVESLGGEFQIKSEINRGTTVLARLHIQATDSGQLQKTL
jgi:signal transduction histidine kinase